MGTSKINNFMKHKRLIIIGLLIIGLFVLIGLVYLLTYANNKPKPFSDDENVKIVRKCEDFDFNVYAAKYTESKDTSIGSISCYSMISNLSQSISNVSVTYELHTNWTSDTDYTSSTAKKFNSGKTLTKSSTSYTTEQTNLSLGVTYPYKVMPLVKLKHPTIYVKLTYTLSKPETATAADRTKTIYMKFTYDEYCTGNTIMA